MSGTIPPLSQYVFMAWCLVKAQGQLYLLWSNCFGDLRQKFTENNRPCWTIIVRKSDIVSILWQKETAQMRFLTAAAGFTPLEVNETQWRARGRARTHTHTHTHTHVQNLIQVIEIKKRIGMNTSTKDESKWLTIQWGIVKQKALER
jgi:hypothetical protein